MALSCRWLRCTEVTLIPSTKFARDSLIADPPDGAPGALRQRL
jgi:hypothetical protein